MGIVSRGAGWMCGLVLAAAIASPAHGALLYDDVITEATVGSGSQQTMVVIDWDTGQTRSHAWLFRYDEPVAEGDEEEPSPITFADALFGIADSDDAFYWSESEFVEYIHYDNGVDYHVTENPGWLSFWTSEDGLAWETAEVGIFELELIDGEYVGAKANLDEGDWPGTAPMTPVPEPASVALLGAGMLMLAKRRRRST